MTRIRALIHLWGHFIDDEGTLAWLEDHLLPEVHHACITMGDRKVPFLAMDDLPKGPVIGHRGKACRPCVKTGRSCSPTVFSTTWWLLVLSTTVVSPRQTKMWKKVSRERILTR